jgi:flavin-dependent dehydrogenase
MLPAGVDLRLGCRLKGCEKGSEGFRLSLVEGGETRTVAAKVLVGADGAASGVRRLLPAAGPSPRTYIAIQEWVETESPMPYYSSLFDPALTDFYCWTIPKDGCLIIGAALNPRDKTAEKFERLKSLLAGFGFRTGKTVWREGAYSLRPLNTAQVCTGGAGIALIGEAPGWISPSSAEGLSYAFRSAILLADAMNGSLHGFEKRYRDSARALRLNIFIKNLKSCFVYNPVLRRLVMKSGLQASDLHPASSRL